MRICHLVGHADYNGKTYKVFLDGDQLRQPLHADDQTGMAMVFERDTAGAVVMHDGRASTSILHGKIVIRPFPNGAEDWRTIRLRKMARNPDQMPPEHPNCRCMPEPKVVRQHSFDISKWLRGLT